MPHGTFVETTRKRLGDYFGLCLSPHYTICIDAELSPLFPRSSTYPEVLPPELNPPNPHPPHLFRHADI